MSDKNKQKNPDFAKRLNEALDFNNFPPLSSGRIKLIAELLHVAQSAASKWIHGHSRPTLNKRKDLARKLGITLEWLDFGKGKMGAEAPIDDSYKKIPILSLREAQNYKAAISAPLNKFEIVGLNVSDDTFICIADQKSMWQFFPKGARLVIDPKRICEDGDYVLAYIQEHNNVILRQLLIMDDNSKYLTAKDAHYKIIPLAKNDKIIGKAVAVFYEL